MIAKPFYGFGVDILQTQTPQGYKNLYVAGARFVGHYLGTFGQPVLDSIFDAGLLLWPIAGTARGGDWSIATGQSDAEATLAAAKALGLPPGISITLDLESADPDAMSVGAATAYAVANGNLINASNFIAELYPGAGCPLDGEQLYALPQKGYVQACSEGYTVPCGYKIIQGHPGDVLFAGITVDLDLAQQDYRGRLPVLVAGG